MYILFIKRIEKDQYYKSSFVKNFQLLYSDSIRVEMCFVINIISIIVKYSKDGGFIFICRLFLG